MINQNNAPSRRKFIFLGSLVSMSLIVFSFFKFRFHKPEDKVKTVKMLDRNGKLVEVDMSKISKPGKKATNREVQNWIKK